jgi:hypothetical protein
MSHHDDQKEYRGFFFIKVAKEFRAAQKKNMTLVGQKLQTSNIDLSKANWIH